jgi:homospermidine synthase
VEGILRGFQGMAGPSYTLESPWTPLENDKGLYGMDIETNENPVTFKDATKGGRHD